MNPAGNIATPNLLIPVSLGELMDRISILEIKEQRMKDPVRHANVARELALLTGVLEQIGGCPSNPAMMGLREVNNALWELENRVRQLEREGGFGPDFVAVAREIHRLNDVRHELKRGVSLAGGSLLIEEKDYFTDL
ncbi:MAG: DUF6165 family protein [Anaerolineae bacterium]